MWCRPIEVIRHVRRKYACPTCEEGIGAAPVPAKLLPESDRQRHAARLYRDG